MKKIDGIAGVVLAGGASRRMGRDKAWLAWSGEPLVVHQARLLAGVFQEVWISAKHPERFLELHFPVIRDREETPAPIVGLGSALRELRRPVFALAVDLPRIPASLVSALASSFLQSDLDALAVRASGKIQGLCAVYGPSILPLLERHTTEGTLSIHALVEESRHEIWEHAAWSRYATEEAFRGVNTAAEYETVRIR